MTFKKRMDLAKAYNKCVRYGSTIIKLGIEVSLTFHWQEVPCIKRIMADACLIMHLFVLAKIPVQPVFSHDSKSEVSPTDLKGSLNKILTAKYCNHSC